MDPVSIIGAAASAVSLVDGIARTIDRLTSLKTTWKVADLAVNLLIGQLCTVKAALTRLASSAEQSSGEFSDDIALTLAGCSELLDILNAKLTALEKDATGQLSSLAKARLLWERTEVGLYHQFLDRAINALNLYLTVTSHSDLFAQARGASATTSDIETIRICSRELSESLFAIKGTPPPSVRDSLCIQSETDNASNVSRQFEFDSEILGSSPYRKATTSNLRKLLTHRRPSCEHATHELTPYDSVSITPKTDSDLIETKIMTRSPFKSLFRSSSRKHMTEPLEAVTHRLPGASADRSDKPIAKPLRGFRRIHVAAADEDVVPALSLCASLPTKSSAGEKTATSILTSHVVRCLERLLTSVDSTFTSTLQAAAASLLHQSRAIDAVERSFDPDALNDVLALACNTSFQRLSDTSSNSRSAALVHHLSRHEVRIRRRGFGSSPSDFSIVGQIPMRDACTYLKDKRPPDFELSMSTIVGGQISSSCLSNLRSELLVILLDCGFILDYVERQPSSLQWNSKVDVSEIVDFLHQDISTLISQSSTLKLIRGAVCGKHHLTVVLASFRSLQRVLDSKFGIVLSGIGHGSYPDLAKQLAEFVVDEIKRQSNGKFNVICAELDKRDAALGKQLRKEAMLAEEPTSVRAPSSRTMSSAADSFDQPTTPRTNGMSATFANTCDSKESGRPSLVIRTDTDETLIEPMMAASSLQSPNVVLPCSLSYSRDGIVGD